MSDIKSRTGFYKPCSLSEEVSIHTAEMTAINIALKEIHKKKQAKMDNIYGIKSHITENTR